MEYTITLNEQQIEFIKDLLEPILDKNGERVVQYSSTSWTIADQISEKLNEA